MRKSKIYTIVTLLILAVLTVIIALADRKDESNSMNTTLYFFNESASTIVPCERKIEYEGRSDLFQKTVDELIKGPSDGKYKPIMEKNVSVNSLRLTDKILAIDFSSEYDTENLLSTYAVIKTLSQFPDVDAVKVTVNGKTVVPEGVLSGDEINLESDDDCSTGMNLYFADKKKTKLVREYRKINITDTQPVELYIVNEIIKGPRNENNVALLSADTGVISVETTDGTCYVNFKKDFISKNQAASEVEKLVIYSLVNSLTEREHIQNVQFLIEGKKIERFGDMSIENLYYRDESFIETYENSQ